ncbi:hypothetical protein [Arthrobacter sp. AFG7.2]|uniref:hypothetical protein n=1 Tax=Arthrobacter sp. AFG7.2 TaxID=1688693 RepID=UPI001CB98259|nr:hypothetical protein [Arthrobacter sp. AFG7.2]
MTASSSDEYERGPNGLDIDSHDLFFGSLFINGVDVVPLVDAELNPSTSTPRIDTPLTSGNRRVAPLKLALTKVAPSNSLVPK